MNALQSFRLRQGRAHPRQGSESRLIQAALDRTQPFGPLGMAGSHLMVETAFMRDEKGFQCCDALQAGGAMLIETLVFGLPRLSVHEKETVQLKRGLAPVRVAPVQQ